MARRVSVSELQAMQRGEPDAVTDDAAAAEALRRIGAPVNGQTETSTTTLQTLEVEAFGIVEDVLTDAVESKAGYLADMVVELQALGVAAGCSEEMTLGMVVERVRYSAHMGGLEPTDAEIVAEAERIFGGFSVNRKGPREYDVVDGEVRDWRRPDTTPDRGDVTQEHTVTDDDEPRFSGGGAGEGVGERYSVPTDAQFNGKAYRDAPDLANIAENLINEHGFLGELINCEIRWYWKRKTGVSKGRVKIGFMKRASDLLGHFSGADFIGWLSATTARDGKFSDEQIRAAVFHQLLHVGSDDNGNWIFAPHDFEGFAQEVRVFGTWTEGLKLGGSAFTAAHQMGLFDVDDGIEDDDEDAQDDWVGDSDDRGAGTLIHADGTALTDDEIEAMERHETDEEDVEIRDGVAYYVGEDAAADPDGPSPEDEDILADPKVI